MTNDYDAVFSAEMMDEKQLKAYEEFENMRATYESQGFTKKESWAAAKALVEGDEETAKDITRRAMNRMQEKEFVKVLRQQAKQRQAAERDWFLKGFDG